MKKAGKILALFILALFMISFFAIIVSAQTDTQSEVKKFFERKYVKYVVGIVFGLWDTSNITNKFIEKGIVNEVGAIIAYLALWLVILLAFGNIISIFSPLSNWVGWLAGIALAIAAAQLKFVFGLISFLALITAWLGAFSVFASIIISFIAFFLLSIGTEVIRKWAVKRKLAIEAVKAMRGRHRVSEGIKTLGEVGKEVEDAGKV